MAKTAADLPRLSAGQTFGYDEVRIIDLLTRKALMSNEAVCQHKEFSKLCKKIQKMRRNLEINKRLRDEQNRLKRSPTNGHSSS